MDFVRLTATHNPQDYYSGTEPEDLVIRAYCGPYQTDEAVEFVKKCIEGGYTVIITRGRSEPYG